MPTSSKVELTPPESPHDEAQPQKGQDYEDGSEYLVI